MANGRYRQPRMYTRSDAIASLTDTIFTVALQMHKDRLVRDIKEGDREYAATVSMYQDARAEAKEAKKQYQEIKDEWRETGIGLNELNELFKTDTSLKVLKDINEIPAKNWGERAEFFSD
jgi:hypothetical protein